MDTLVWSDAAAEIHQVVVGPFENNVYVLRCRETGEAALLDAANEHERLLDLCRALDVRQVLETHGHWDHIQAVPELRDAGYSVHVTEQDASMLPSYDEILTDDDVLEVGRLRLRTIHTPGHTPGSMCFLLEGAGVLFSGDTLFPGGPGATSFEGGDFPTIIRSIEDRLFSPIAADTLVLPGHGLSTTLGAEAPHLQEWVDRGGDLPWDHGPVTEPPREQPASPQPEPRAVTPTPAELRRVDETPVHTTELPDTPTRDRSIPATAWVEAPDDLLGLADDLPAPTTGSTARYLRRIGPWLLWRAGPAKGAAARYWVCLSDDLSTSYTFDLFPDGTGSGRGPTTDHTRFRTWKEDLRDHDTRGAPQADQPGRSPSP